MSQDRSYFFFKHSLAEALEEVATGVFEDTGLNDEHAGDGCLYDVHDYWLLIIDYWWLIIRKLIKLRKCLMTDYWWLMIDYWLLIQYIVQFSQQGHNRVRGQVPDSFMS